MTPLATHSLKRSNKIHKSSSQIIDVLDALRSFPALSSRQKFDFSKCIFQGSSGVSSDPPDFNCLPGTRKVIINYSWA